DLLGGKFGEALIARLKGILNTYKAKLEEFIAHLLPTSISTGYEWDASIKSGDIFAMLGEEGETGRLVSAEGPDPKKPDLSLKVRIEIDLLRNQRSITTSGDLQPFKLVLLPGAHMATINFEKMTFNSV